MGDQQAAGLRSAEPTPPGAEPQMQPAAGVAQAAHGPVERRQNGRQRLCWYYRIVAIAARQHHVAAPGQQHRFHSVSSDRGHSRTQSTRRSCV